VSQLDPAVSFEEFEQAGVKLINSYQAWTEQDTNSKLGGSN
jgi:hypothetical protein